MKAAQGVRSGKPISALLTNEIINPAELKILMSQTEDNLGLMLLRSKTKVAKDLTLTDRMGRFHEENNDQLVKFIDNFKHIKTATGGKYATIQIKNGFADYNSIYDLYVNGNKTLENGNNKFWKNTDDAAAILRNMASATMLNSAPVLTLADTATSSFVVSQIGGSGLTHWFKHIGAMIGGSKENAQAMKNLGYFVQSLESNIQNFRMSVDNLTAAGASSGYARAMMKVNLMQHFTDGGRDTLMKAIHDKIAQIPELVKIKEGQSGYKSARQTLTFLENKLEPKNFELIKTLSTKDFEHFADWDHGYRNDELTGLKKGIITTVDSTTRTGLLEPGLSTQSIMGGSGHDAERIFKKTATQFLSFPLEFTNQIWGTILFPLGGQSSKASFVQVGTSVVAMAFVADLILDTLKGDSIDLTDPDVLKKRLGRSIMRSGMLSLPVETLIGWTEPMQSSGSPSMSLPKEAALTIYDGLRLIAGEAGVDLEKETHVTKHAHKLVTGVLPMNMWYLSGFLDNVKVETLKMLNTKDGRNYEAAKKRFKKSRGLTDRNAIGEFADDFVGDLF